jgi:hypothetical protein
MELRIFDRRADGSRLLVPLSDFLRIIEGLRDSGFSGQWKVLPGSHGYGEYLCNIEDQIQQKGYVVVRGEDLFPILMDGFQYFYTGRIQSCEEDLELGIEDSTYLYLKGDPDLLRVVASRYSKTTLL